MIYLKGKLILKAFIFFAVFGITESVAKFIFALVFAEELDKIVYSSDSMYEDNHTIKCNITLILQQNDTFPTISGSYTPLSAITEEEVDAWVQKLNL